MTDFDAKLAQLRERFVGRCPEWIAELRLALEMGKADALTGIAHQIAGGAGIFGFPQISTAAAELESAAKGHAVNLAGRAARLIDMLEDISSAGSG